MSLGHNGHMHEGDTPNSFLDELPLPMLVDQLVAKLQIIEPRACVPVLHDIEAECRLIGRRQLATDARFAILVVGLHRTIFFRACAGLIADIVGIMGGDCF